VVTVHPGTRLDVSAAQTRAFLAFSDLTVEQVEPNISITDRVLLETDLKNVRVLGFSFVRQGNGSFVVAAPVFDDAGMCATVAVLGAGDLHDLAPIRQQLISTATSLTADLGGPDGPPISAEV
jgi:DNA-binding IclR family transcriptional regulator